MVWYGMVNVDLYSAIITKVSNALDTLVSGEKPGFQTLSKGLVVLLCVRRSSGREFKTMGPCTANARRPTVVSRYRGTTISCCVADLRRCLPTTSVTGMQQSTRYCGALPCRHAWWHRVCTSLDLPHRASVSHHARFESGHGQTFLCHWRHVLPRS